MDMKYMMAIPMLYYISLVTDLVQYLTMSEHRIDTTILKYNIWMLRNRKIPAATGIYLEFNLSIVSVMETAQKTHFCQCGQEIR